MSSTETEPKLGESSTHGAESVPDPPRRGLGATEKHVVDEVCRPPEVVDLHVILEVAGGVEPVLGARFALKGLPVLPRQVSVEHFRIATRPRIDLERTRHDLDGGGAAPQHRQRDLAIERVPGTAGTGGCRDGSPEDRALG